jgi:hypothetical protein
MTKHFIAGAVVGVVAMIVGRALAGAVPTTKPLRYAGQLEDVDGNALSGERAIQINLWNEDAPDDNLPLCQVSNAKVPLDAGRFSLELPEACENAIKKQPNTQVEVLVDGVSLGKRKLGAVPYALEAAHALSAEQATEAAHARQADQTERAVAAEHAQTADAPSGELQATIDSLSRKTRIVSQVDRRPCRAPAKPGTDLLTISFTLSKKTAVQVTGQMNRLYMGRADLELNVDGEARNWAITHTSVLENVSGYVSWTGELPEGDHVAALRGRPGLPDAADIWGCGANHGVLSALLFE